MAKLKDFPFNKAQYKNFLGSNATIATLFKGINIPSRPAIILSSLFSQDGFGFDLLVFEEGKIIVKHDRYCLNEHGEGLKYIMGIPPLRWRRFATCRSTYYILQNNRLKVTI